MNEDSEKTIRVDPFGIGSSEKEKAGFSSTLEISRETYIGKIPTTQHAFLEIIGEEKKRILLGENEAIIGRIPECEIQLWSIEAVARGRLNVRNGHSRHSASKLGD